MNQPESRPIPLRRFTWMILIVCLGAAGLGRFAGGLAGSAYSVGYRFDPQRGDWTAHRTLAQLGLALGSATGIASGAAWCVLMIRRGRRGLDQELVAGGAILGLAFGVASTVVLHTTLILTVLPNPISPMFPLIGLGCGAGSGLLLGLLGGSLCRISTSIRAEEAVDDGG